MPSPSSVTVHARLPRSAAARRPRPDAGCDVDRDVSRRRAAPRSPAGCPRPGRACRRRPTSPAVPSATRTTNRSGSSPPSITCPRRGASHDPSEVDHLAAHGEPARVDAGDVEQLGDQPGDPVGVGVDGLEHEPLLLVVEAVPLREQGRGEALDAGQRRAQLVRDRGDQLGAAELLARPVPGVAAATTTTLVTGPRGSSRT